MVVDNQHAAHPAIIPPDCGPHSVAGNIPPTAAPMRLQAEHQVPHRGWLGQERVVAGVEFNDGAGLAGEVALPPRWGAPVLGADQVGRGHLPPGRRTDGLSGHLHALPRQPVRGLGLGDGVAILQERLHQKLAGGRRMCRSSGSMSRNGAGTPSPKSDRLCPTSGR